MRQEPIEMAPASATARRRRAENSRNPRGRLSCEPRVLDEAFACLDAGDAPDPHGQPADRRVMKQALVTDLAAQLEAIDQQRARLAQLLTSIEETSITD